MEHAILRSCGLRFAWVRVYRVCSFGFGLVSGVAFANSRFVG